MNRTAKGFTLIELIFVLLMISLLSSFAIPRVSNVFGMNLRSGASRIAGYLRTAYEYSVMRHERIRIRFDVAKGEYWAESYEEPPTIPLVTEDTKLDDVMERFRKREDEMAALDADEKKALVEKSFKKLDYADLRREKLPQAIQFKGIYTSSEGKVVNAGIPWLDFSPGGFVPKTVVYVTNDAAQVYTVILEPVGGRSRIEKGEVRPDEI